MATKPTHIQDLDDFYDYLKHLTTLATGLIALVVTFREKFASKGEGTSLLLWAIALLSRASYCQSSVCSYIDRSDIAREYGDKDDGGNHVFCMRRHVCRRTHLLGDLCGAVARQRGAASTSSPLDSLEGLFRSIFRVPVIPNESVALCRSGRVAGCTGGETGLELLGSDSIAARTPSREIRPAASASTGHGTAQRSLKRL